MAEASISKEVFDNLMDESDVVCANYDDQPDDVADKFVKVLGGMGVKIDILCPPDDIPSILYHVIPPPQVKLFPVDIPPQPSAILCGKIAEFLANFASKNKETYDIAAGPAAIDLMRLFQEFMNEKH